MTTIGQTVVTMTIEQYAGMLEKAAEMGIESAPTAVEHTAKGIAGTILMDTAIQGMLKPPPGPVMREW